MKKSLFLFVVVAATMVLASCEKDISEVLNIGLALCDSDETFTAYVETADMTRTSLVDNGYLCRGLKWTCGDKISVSDGKTVSVYRTVSDGESNATFCLYEGCELTKAETYTAFYPSTLSKNNQKLPAVQNYISDNVENFPMMAVSANRELMFKNLCGIICLNLKAETSAVSKVSRIVLSSPDKGLSGEFTVSNDAAVVCGTSDVALECATPVSLNSSAATSFNVIVPKGSYYPLYVTIVDSDGNEAEMVSDAVVQVDRSGMTRLNIILKDTSFDSGLEVIPVTDSDVDFSER